MTMRVESALVTNRPELADFYVRALGLEKLEPRIFPVARIDRLGKGDQCLIKIMVPQSAARAAPKTQNVWEMTGFRYLTIWLDGLDETVARWTREGGTVLSPAAEVRPGVRMSMLLDPDGNTVEAMESAS